MATVPFVFECSKEDGFVLDPNEHRRVGYVTALSGFGGAGGPVGFNADLAVANPQAGGKHGVIGVIEKFSWAGGASDALALDFWVSQENMVKLKAAQETLHENSTVQALNFTIMDFDQEKKAWYEQAFPQQPLSGIITGTENPQLNVDLNPVVTHDGSDVNVYKIHIAVAPAADQAYSLKFANSASLSQVKNWGLVVGTLAGPSMPES